METISAANATRVAAGLFTIGAFVGIYGFVERVFGIKKHDSEPPFIPTKIPYLGHLIGVMTDQINYYTKTTAKYRQKIYSLAMPGGRIYIVNSPDIIASIMKVPRVLSFWFIEAALTKNLGGISNEANAILLDNARGDKGYNSLVVDGMKATHKAMSGEFLDSMTRAAIRRAGDEIRLLQTDKSAKELELWDWVQHVYSLAVSSSVYGDANPYEDAVLKRGLSDFADHTPTFLTGLPPWLFVPKAYAARERIVAAFSKYFAADSQNRGSELVKARYKVLKEYGIPESDIARFECVNGFGILLNLTPTAFWTTWHVFSNPELLKNVREEAKAALGNSDALSGNFDLSKINKMPVLESTMKEALRFHASGQAARMVMDDHMLDDRWMLKRDSYIFIPNKAPHFDKDAWGLNAENFDPYRFEKKNAERIHPAAFRGFGGGVNLCPGRVFATKLILTVVAELVVRYDMKPISNNGSWEHPEHDERSMAIVLARPKKKTVVQLVGR
ncbi:MAG: hypothetical protein M1820_004427 [Bogoriella megaspora]|nr:MAG: hypothetical protein M1820_004427 [Bogoriella megaspora]